MSARTSCSTSSLVTSKAIYVIYLVFAISYTCILVSVSIYSYLETINSSKLSFRTLKSWIIDVYKRRRCYVPIISHLVDWTTDTVVIVQFGALAHVTTKDDCNGLNMRYLFSLSIIAIFLYRVVSSSLIYSNTKSYIRFMYQFMDLEIFRTLYINYLCDKKEPCSPQKWINSLEATFESSPQALIQIIYLVKTGSFGRSSDILISVILSLWCIVSKIISDDRVISVKQAKNFLLPKTKSTSRSISWTYICRYIWRILDVSSRILIASLIWLAMGGYYLSIIIFCESIVFLTLTLYTKRFEFLFSVVVMVISRSSKYANAKKMSVAIMIYRCCTNVILMVIIAVFLNVRHIGDCWKCPEFEERQRDMHNLHSILIFCYVSVIITPIMSVYLYTHVFTETKSPSRKLEDMIISGNWNGIIEMQTYRGRYGIYNTETNENLLMLAIEYNYGKLVKFLSTGNRTDLTYKNKNGECILDYMKLSVTRDHHKINKKYLGELLILIAKQYPDYLKTKDNENYIMVSCCIGDVYSFEALDGLSMYNNAWKWAIHHDQPDIIEYLATHQQELHQELRDEAFLKRMIRESKPNVVHHLLAKSNRLKTGLHRSGSFILKMKRSSSDINIYDHEDRDREIWFYAVDRGNIEMIKTVKNYTRNINALNKKGETVLHIKCNQKKEDRDEQVIAYLKQVIKPDIKDNAGYIATDYLKTYRFAFFKDCPGVGQTSVIRRFIDGTFDEKSENMRSFDEYGDFDGHLFTMKISDETVIEDRCINDNDIFVLLFPMDGEIEVDDLTYLRKIRQKIISNKPSQGGADCIIPILFVGTKCDLVHQTETTEFVKEIRERCNEWDRRQYQNAAVRHLFIQTSAKANVNITQIFFEGIRLYCEIKHEIHTQAIANNFQNNM